ncbi:MAG: N-acetylmuramoyl-L-alanine amidase family protein [Longimicrobiaceae bacterium]
MTTKSASARCRLSAAFAAVWTLLLAPALAAQAEATWTLIDGSRRLTVPEANSHGYPALPLSALVSVGAEVVSAGREMRVRFGDTEARFIPGLPFFVVGESGHQLVHPIYRDRGVVFLPVQFVTEYLSRFMDREVEVDAGQRTIRRLSPLVARAAPEPPTPEPEPPTATVRPPRAEGLVNPERRPGSFLVVVDAGHGGVDPGAIGAAGTREKVVNLAVARRLAQLLRADPRYEVRMTRDADTLIALRDRSRFANLWRDGDRPALFISIHCNANNSRAAHGFESYFLSEAKTEDARRVAAMENAAQRYEHPNPGELDPIRFMLHDLRQNKYLHESSRWAGTIQDRLAEVHPGPNRGVKQAPFAVLNWTFMPSVLVELGFLTNPEEERRLNDHALQQRLASRLASAIDDYFEGR